ncbi:hypothetical protein EDB85DRAFT_1895701 [Lactarius pseudohatsudake]|nr:hypothetical protein EDB85DRAFT_1895701 [Lactarius pseudohatsudake]
MSHLADLYPSTRHGVRHGCACRGLEKDSHEQISAQCWEAVCLLTALGPDGYRSLWSAAVTECARKVDGGVQPTRKDPFNKDDKDENGTQCSSEGSAREPYLVEERLRESKQLVLALVPHLPALHPAPQCPLPFLIGREGKQLVSTLGPHLPFLYPTTPYLLSLYRDREGKQLVPHLPALYHSHLTLPTQGQGGQAAGADPGAAPAFLVPHCSIFGFTLLHHMTGGKQLYRDREGKQLVLTLGTTPTILVPSCSNQGHLVVIQHPPPLDTPDQKPWLESL